MANIKKFGEAVVITSGAKLEDIKKIAKYRPEALTLYSEGEEKEPVFCVGLSDDRAGSVSKFGIEFGGASADGHAQVTAVYTGPEEGVAEALADTLGPQIVMLSKLEESFPGILEAIDADVAAIMSCIEIG